MEPVPPTIIKDTYKRFAVKIASLNLVSRKPLRDKFNNGNSPVS